MPPVEKYLHQALRCLLGGVAEDHPVESHGRECTVVCPRRVPGPWNEKRWVVGGGG